jgi:hypothetical protein
LFFGIRVLQPGIFPPLTAFDDICFAFRDSTKRVVMFVNAAGSCTAAKDA